MGLRGSSTCLKASLRLRRALQVRALRAPQVALGNALAVLFGEAAGRAEELLGVFLKRADPKLFGALEVLVEVGAVTFKSFGKAERGPVGDFVEGALVDGGVVETFG